MGKKAFLILIFIVLLIIVIFIFLNQEQTQNKSFFSGENENWMVEYTVKAERESKYIYENITLYYKGDTDTWNNIDYMEVYLKKADGSLFSEKGYLADYEKQSAEIQYDYSSTKNTSFNFMRLVNSKELILTVVANGNTSDIQLVKSMDGIDE